MILVLKDVISYPLITIRWVIDKDSKFSTEREV